MFTHRLADGHHGTREEAVLQTTYYRDSHHLLLLILPQDSYWKTGPFLVIAACRYIAGKVQESSNPIKKVAAEAHLLFSRAPSVVLLTLTRDTASHCTVERNLIAPA